MMEYSLTRLTILRGGFALLAVATMFVNLLPLQTVPRNWSAPDLLLCLAFTWSVRRPDHVPLTLLAALFLLADLLLQRPPGLYAALATMACAHMQSKAPGLRTTGFAQEWLRVSVLTLAITVISYIVLVIMLVPTPSLWLSATLVITTALAYPFVVFLSAVLLGVRQVGPGDLDGFGGRA